MEVVNQVRLTRANKQKFFFFDIGYNKIKKKK